MSESRETKVHVQYFAVLREQRGQSEETVNTPASTVADLYHELRTKHRFSLPIDRMKVAVNESFVDWAHPLAEGDRIVFVPPVAGG